MALHTTGGLSAHGGGDIFAGRILLPVRRHFGGCSAGLGTNSLAKLHRCRHLPGHHPAQDAPFLSRSIWCPAGRSSPPWHARNLGQPTLNRTVYFFPSRFRACTSSRDRWRHRPSYPCMWPCLYRSVLRALRSSTVQKHSYASPFCNISKLGPVPGSSPRSARSCNADKYPNAQTGGQYGLDMGRQHTCVYGPWLPPAPTPSS